MNPLHQKHNICVCWTDKNVKNPEKVQTMTTLKHKIKKKQKKCIIAYFQMKNISSVLICDIIFSVYLFTKSLNLKLKPCLSLSPGEINHFTKGMYSLLSICFSRKTQQTVCKNNKKVAKKVTKKETKKVTKKVTKKITKKVKIVTKMRWRWR